MASVTPIPAHSPGRYIKNTAEELFQEGTSGIKAMVRGTAEADAGGQSALAGKVRGDTVTISEEARKLSGNATAESSDEKSSGSVNASQVLPSRSEEEEGGTDQVKTIRKQIEQVKKQLEEAKARLAQAQGGGNAESASNGEEAPSDAAMKKAMSALGNATEAEGIQAEIEMLNQQLMMLNQQLVEAMGGSAGTAQGAIGTAGLGGMATGPSGQGERIEVSA